ncbi:NADH-quinone oxidoreductase subunit L [Adhaeribacter pallidiroseus]|uniref:NADH:ubiquinone reductase (H(+)-translocating) n=1 Tax=Adhaeribacter pallidiroseus TaxID=2072847 RepID=A0A369QJB7_9BACT|nr:NADH-quinone oxidoreductase subunit L [Adhaeribacter pallidiroseus]RDC63347.1 NADH:ubiquinone reductase (H(+)-translocating) [Adhaeribacter pallidiroseus]
MNTGLSTNPTTANITLAAALGLFLLPFLAFAFCFFVGKKLPRQGDWISLGSGVLSFLLALFLFSQVWEQKIVHEQTTWFQIIKAPNTNQVFTAGIYLDNLSVLLLVLVTFISLLVQVFSVAYLHHDEHYNRYFAFLSLFAGSMLGLVLADNLLLIFIFWELVGFCSYLLIGFWFHRPAAVQASKKAFLVNRVGDVGLLLGLFLLYSFFGTFDLLTLKSQIKTITDAMPIDSPGLLKSGVFISEQISTHLLTLTGLALFCGCIGKSAQFPLQVWLPDAMEGPTPVSALIHAATMVAAGIYLLAKCYVFFTPDALLVMALVGAITALMGALVACTQFDIKKTLAYSTISQLGYMVMGMGVGAPDAALFHLTTHAFFKAALFLNAGVIIHAVHHALQHEDAETRALVDAQDIRNMGGLRQILPFTYYSYLLAGASLVGVPLFSGFLSKDAILIGTWNWAAAGAANTGAWWWYLVPVTGFVAVSLTAYYMTRQLIFVFLGKFRLGFGEQHLRVSSKRETSGLMLVPVLILAVLALGIFYSLNPFSSTNSWLLSGVSLKNLNPGQFFLSGSFFKNLLNTDSHSAHLWAPILSVTALVLGAGIAWQRFRINLITNATSYQLSALPPATFTNFIYHNFYLDKLYQIILVKPTQWLALGVVKMDALIIDYSINTFAKILVVFSKIVAWIDRGIVDGLVRGIGITARLSGNLGRWMQNGKIQSYYLYSLLGLLLLVFYILIF